MLCRLHTVYKIIHCVALHTLCLKSYSTSLHLEKFTPAKKFYTGTARGARDKYQVCVWCDNYVYGIQGSSESSEDIWVVFWEVFSFLFDDLWGPLGICGKYLTGLTATERTQCLWMIVQSWLLWYFYLPFKSPTTAELAYGVFYLRLSLKFTVNI